MPRPILSPGGGEPMEELGLWSGVKEVGGELRVFAVDIELSVVVCYHKYTIKTLIILTCRPHHYLLHRHL